MTCSIPGMCSRSPDCHDTHCPGRALAFQTHRQDPLDMARKCGFLRTEDGGMRVSDNDSFRLSAPDSASTSGSVGFVVVAIFSAVAAFGGVLLCYLQSSCL